MIKHVCDSCGEELDARNTVSDAITCTPNTTGLPVVEISCVTPGEFCTHCIHRAVVESRCREDVGT